MHYWQGRIPANDYLTNNFNPKLWILARSKLFNSTIKGSYFPWFPVYIAKKGPDFLWDLSIWRDNKILLKLFLSDTCPTMNKYGPFVLHPFKLMFSLLCYVCPPIEPTIWQPSLKFQLQNISPNPSEVIPKVSDPLDNFYPHFSSGIQWIACKVSDPMLNSFWRIGDTTFYLQHPKEAQAQTMIYVIHLFNLKPLCHIGVGWLV